MFVVSFSGKKLRSVLFVLVILVVVFSVGLGFFFYKSKTDNVFDAVSVNSSENILEFISSLGWEVDESPVEIRDVVIPEIFDDVYTNYNQIQLSQGLNLEKYAGRRVKRWTYIVRNYPETNPEDDYIRINILVCDDKIVGGDVCSIKLDGFMHGFSVETDRKELK